MQKILLCQNIMEVGYCHEVHEDSYICCCSCDKGIDVNIQDSAGRTPLFYAANKGRLNTVKTLIASGADVRIEDKSGKRAQYYAANEEIQKTLDDAVGVWGWIKDHPFWTVLIVIVGLLMIGAH